MSSINRVILTLDGEMLNPATAPYLRHSTAQALRKHLAEPPPQSETGPVGGPVSGTEGTEKATIDKPIVAQYCPTAKAFSTEQARAARAGHELTQTRHEGTGMTLWQVARWGQTRQFGEWGEVCAFVAHIGGGARHA